MSKKNKAGNGIMSKAGIPSGFKKLDRLISGFKPSELVVVAGQPAMGKTSLCLNIAGHLALKKDMPVAFFCFKGAKEIVGSMLSSMAEVGSRKLQTGRLADNDWDKIIGAVDLLHEASVYIEDTSGQTFKDMADSLEQSIKLHNCKLIIVDYLQLIKRKQNTPIFEMVKSIKDMAKEFATPIIVISRLPRQVNQQAGGRPNLSDLGKVEQYADTVIFIHREEVSRPCSYRGKVCSCGRRNSAEIIVAKQRNGHTGSIKLAFYDELGRFEDLKSAKK
ncbi:MAG: DnaB-like helicase C-terminal domain-containing protein [Deltaproteobacteria bacterium]|nr:DnaB-like helicase C-terminal domain-containing protein [Deltaproteobacteria bacterium]